MGEGRDPRVMQSGGRIPLNVKTGEWETAEDVTMQGSMGLPPEIAAKMTPAQQAQYQAAMAAMAGAGHTSHFDSKSCLKPEDLSGDVFDKMNRNNNDVACSGTVLSSTASDVEVQEHCTSAKMGGEMDFHLKIHAQDSEHTTMTGDGTTTMGGNQLKSHVSSTGHWLGAQCKDGD